MLHEPSNEACDCRSKYTGKRQYEMNMCIAEVALQCLI